MKSPDEIKRGLECCVDGNIVCAGNCVFDDDVKSGYPDCVKLLMTNALALIQQLEAQNAEKAERIRELNAVIGEAKKNLDCLQDKIYTKIDSVEAGVVRLNQYCKELQTERDAAVAALKSNCVCTECKWFDDDLLEGHCNDCHSKNSSFEWRGVQKEE